MKRFPLLQIPMDDEPIVRLDLNTPEAIEPAKKLFKIFQ